MKKENVIQKQVLHLHMHKPMASPFAMQDAASKWCSDVLVAAIEKMLEKYEEIEDVICIDKLTVTLDVNDSLDALLAEKIALNLEREIESKIHSQLTISHTSSKRSMDAFIFFLQNGYLPWWSNVKEIGELGSLKKIIDDASQRKLKEMLEQRSVATRAATSLSSDNFVGMASRVFNLGEIEIEIFFQKIKKLASVINDVHQRNQFLVLVKQRVLDVLQKGDDIHVAIGYAIDILVEKYQLMVEELKNYFMGDEFLSNDTLLQQVLSSPGNFKTHQAGNRGENNISIDAFELNLEKLNEQKIQSEKQRVSQKHDGIYISNAGLILLTPFVHRFFQNLGIVGNNDFNSKDLGLAMLQWIVTGKELYAEFDLALPKIICGMEPEEPVTIIPGLPDGFKSEGETLLLSVIEHWNILKNTSIEGFRESFLQREGKLSFQKNEWLLQVEQKPYDMLLEHLPWNISMIRLSWMPYSLKTEWIG